MQRADKQEEEEDHSLYDAMTATTYADQGHTFIAGRNDESSFATSNLDDATVGSTSFPPQALPYSNHQYMGYPPAAGWYAAPLPPAAHYNYHHPHQQQMYPTFPIPPTYGSNPPVQYQQHLRHPENIQVPTRRGSFNSTDEVIKLTFTGDRQRDLRNVLYFVKNNRNATLCDVDGFIAEIAKADEGASRFVQRRLQSGTETERRLALQAALHNFSDLWQDPFGNFMLQGILEFGSADMREELMTAVYAADVVDMTLNMHGCRIIQKALLVLDEASACKIITELQDIEEVIPFIFDPHANHVVQRAIQIISNFAKAAADHGDSDAAANLMNQIKFILDDVIANIEQLSQHRYGCRVVQRAIEYCPEEQRDDVLKELVECHRNLVEDQFGNYVIQQAIAIGSEELLTAIVESLNEDDAILRFSKHKYASNVVEAMLTNATSREAILNAMLKDFDGSYGVIELAKDPIANYVVKKALDCAEGQQRDKLFGVINSNRQQLSQSPYAKYVLLKLSERKSNKTTSRNKGQDTHSRRY